jgi:hypothetical protein
MWKKSVTQDTKNNMISKYEKSKGRRDLTKKFDVMDWSLKIEILRRYITKP